MTSGRSVRFPPIADIHSHCCRRTPHCPEVVIPRTTQFIVVLMLCGLFGSQSRAGGTKEHQVTGESRKSAFRHAIDVWQDGRVDLIAEVVTPDYVGHTSAGDRDVNGLRQRVSEFHALYPDIKFTVEDQVAEGDRVTTRMTASGTSKATGKPVHLIGLNISRFVGGRIAEEWPVWEIVR
jgi:predicted SnoaL-like aldol condensation-catalyzing enzyme